MAAKALSDDESKAIAQSLYGQDVEGTWIAWREDDGQMRIAASVTGFWPPFFQRLVDERDGKTVSAL